jgi:hypothetical protein
MLRFACFITGDDYQILKTDTPASRKKVNTLVSILFLPVTMWFINILLLVTGVMQGTMWSGIVSALIAGLIIFMVERSIIMSNGSKTVMIFRIFLGLLIALLGSLAFDEVIFKKDIDMQMDANKEQSIKNGITDVDQSYADKLRHQEYLVESKHTIWLKSLEKASSEADGSSGSGVRGVHAITRLKMNIAAQNEQDYIKAKADLDNLKNLVEINKTTTTGNLEGSFQKYALLARIKAMSDLVCNNGWMCFVYILVSLLLFALEFIVVVLKLSLPKSNYEFKLEVIEEIGKKRMMALMNNDSNHYDFSRQYPEVRRTNANIGNLSKTTLFN